jgi:hypothetical protein
MRLQRLSGHRHARSAQPQHIGQPLLAERDAVLLALLAQNQQQPAQARDRVMHRIAQRGLLNLTHQCHVIAGEEIVDGLAFAHRAAEGRHCDLGGNPWRLHQCPREGVHEAGSRDRADRSFAVEIAFPSLETAIRDTMPLCRK